MESQRDVSDDIICTTKDTQHFDRVIGHIEDMVLSIEFETLQRGFLEAHWQQIDNTEENKLEYMDIFNEYTALFENYFVKELNQRMPDFEMERFSRELDEHNASISPQENGEIFELLTSLTNFEAFKSILLDYRNKMEGNIQDLDCDILVTKSPLNKQPLENPHKLNRERESIV